MKTQTVSCPHCGRANKVSAAAESTPRCGNCEKPLPWIVDASDDFADIADKATPLVLVDLWATWCGPCRVVGPALERVAEDLAGKIKLVKVDIDRNQRLAQRFDVHAVPTLLILDTGETVARRAGAAPAGTLRSWVEQVMAGRQTAEEG